MPGGPRPVSHFSVRPLGRPIMEGSVGGTSLCDHLGRGYLIYGPGGGIGRRSLEGSDCAMRTSAQSLLVAQLCCAHSGSGRFTLEGPTEC